MRVLGYTRNDGERGYGNDAMRGDSSTTLGMTEKGETGNDVMCVDSSAMLGMTEKNAG